MATFWKEYTHTLLTSNMSNFYAVCLNQHKLCYFHTLKWQQDASFQSCVHQKVGIQCKTRVLDKHWKTNVPKIVRNALC